MYIYIYKYVYSLHMFWCGSVAPVLQSGPPCAVLDMYSAHGLPLAEPAAAAGLVLPVLFLTLGNQSWYVHIITCTLFEHLQCLYWSSGMHKFYLFIYIYMVLFNRLICVYGVDQHKLSRLAFCFSCRACSMWSCLPGKQTFSRRSNPRDLVVWQLTSSMQHISQTCSRAARRTHLISYQHQVWRT